MGRFRTLEGFLAPTQSIIRVKEGFPLSHTLFDIYINELETFLRESLLPSDGCYLNQVMISILPCVDDVVLLVSSPKSP